MELPQDIIGYLEKFIRPKRYTLINKFCRDFYFRKHGVSMLLDTYYLYTELYTKYNVKIIDKNNIPDGELENMVNNTLFRERVTHMSCENSIVEYRYKMLRKIFPKLQEFNCTISLYRDIIDEPALDGTIILVDGSLLYPTVSPVIERLINIGYKLHFNFNELVDLSKNIRDNISSIRFPFHGNINTMDIKRFPNLKRLTICQDKLDLILEDIKNHPNIREVEITTNPYINMIIKKNGDLVHVTTDVWSYEGDNIPNQTTYELVKRNCSTISVKQSSDMDKLMEYERKTQIIKRITLSLPTYNVDGNKMMEVLDLFNVEVFVQGYGLISWMKRAKSHKVKFTDSGLVLKLYIGRGKLTIFAND